MNVWILMWKEYTDVVIKSVHFTEQEAERERKRLLKLDKESIEKKGIEVPDWLDNSYKIIHKEMKSESGFKKGDNLIFVPVIGYDWIGNYIQPLKAVVTIHEVETIPGQSDRLWFEGFARSFPSYCFDYEDDKK